MWNIQVLTLSVSYNQELLGTRSLSGNITSCAFWVFQILYSDRN